MSSDEKKPLREAEVVAERVCEMLRETVEWISPAGSVRREKNLVGDIEIVARTADARALLARMDKLVLDGVITKAKYGDSTRWGDKYRGFMLMGFRVELFVGDKDNIGYIYWLRTGPGDANTFVMTRLAQLDSPYRANEGYWWQDGKKLAIPTEKEMFRLLGMEWVRPSLRTADLYAHRMRGWQPVEVNFAEGVHTPPRQSVLF